VTHNLEWASAGTLHWRMHQGSLLNTP
jgi:hypothetical protein